MPTFAVSRILSTTGLRLSTPPMASSLWRPSKRAMSNGIMHTIESHNSSTYRVSHVYNFNVHVLKAIVMMYSDKWVFNICKMGTSLFGRKEWICFGEKILCLLSQRFITMFACFFFFLAGHNSIGQGETSYLIRFFHFRTVSKLTHNHCISCQYFLFFCCNLNSLILVANIMYYLLTIHVTNFYLIHVTNF